MIIRVLNLLFWFAVGVVASTDGVINLLKRRLPEYVDDFTFSLTANLTKPFASGTKAVNDQYVISSVEGKIFIEGNSPIALASG